MSLTNKLAKATLLATTLAGIAGCDKKPAEDNSWRGHYDPRFGKYEVEQFKNEGVSPSTANPYPQYLHSSDIITLAKNKIDSDKAGRFDKRFNGNDIVNLVGKDINPTVANSYLEAAKYLTFPGENISIFVAGGVEPKEAVEFLKLKQDGWYRFNAEEIVGLHKSGLTPQVVGSYIVRNKEDVMLLINNNIKPEDANSFLNLNTQFGTKISATDIVEYQRYGYKFEQVKEEAQRAWFEKSVRE